MNSKNPFHVFKNVARTASLGAMAVALASCATTAFQPQPYVYQEHEISVRVKREFVDEDSPLKNAILFRNVGRDIVSFDYTVADEPGIPHVDMDGPNSGLVENLYPGEEREVPNPSNLKNVFSALGKVTRGKKTPEELDTLYNPNPAPPESQELALLGN